jgi:hypothetical protein
MLSQINFCRRINLWYTLQEEETKIKELPVPVNLKPLQNPVVFIDVQAKCWCFYGQ